MSTSPIIAPAGGWQAFAAQVAQRQPEAIAQLNQIYQQLFNQTIQQGCGNCYNKAYYRIQKYLYLQNTSDMTLTERKYYLKPNCGLQTHFGGDMVTNANLTDKIAEELLKAHPSLIKHFERYPEKDNPMDVPAPLTQPAKDIEDEGVEKKAKAR